MKHLKHGVIDQVECRNRPSKRKWTDREYHVLYNVDVAHKEVKMYCDKNQLPELIFCGPHPKPHGTRGMRKNYHLHFDTKLGHGIYEILCMKCACVACTPMLDQPCIYGKPSEKQTCYKYVSYCTYWPFLGSYNNQNIINITPKSTPFEVFEKTNQVVLDRISDNMASLVQ